MDIKISTPENKIDSDVYQLVDKLEKELKSLPNNKGYYRVIIFEVSNKHQVDLICDLYKKSGWSDSKCESYFDDEDCKWRTILELWR